MIFDTDVLICAGRGSHDAARLIEDSSRRSVSIVTRMELMAGALNKKELSAIREVLGEFLTYPLTPEIGQLAAGYVEDFALSHSMAVTDALIAATAVDAELPLCTANAKHFRQIPDLELIVLRLKTG